MKLYFYFNLENQTFFQHQVAKSILNLDSNAKFAGTFAVKGGRHLDFITSQNEINYEQIDIIDEIEKEAINYQITSDDIDKWEKRFDSSLIDLVIADRCLGHQYVRGCHHYTTKLHGMSNYSLAQKFVCYYLDYYERAMKSFKTELVFIPALAGIAALALLKVCEYLKIPYVIIKQTALPGRAILLLNEHKGEYNCVYKDYYDHAQTDLPLKFSNTLEHYFASFESEIGESPDWIKRFNKKVSTLQNEPWPKISFKILILFCRLYISRMTSAKSKRHIREKSVFSNWLFLTRKQIGIKLNQKKHFKEPVDGEKYILFPLHVNPEASTMVIAPNFTNQESIVELLSKNIPLTHKLYVKEHPGMVGRRPASFYRKISKLPNVSLITPYIHNHQIIKKSDMVISITGTAGWEALMFGKKVLTLGNCFYNRLPGCTFCTDFSQIGKIIKKILNSGHLTTIEQSSIKYFVKLLEDHSFEFDLSTLWGKNIPEEVSPHIRKNTESLAKELIKLNQTI